MGFSRMQVINKMYSAQYRYHLIIWKGAYKASDYNILPEK